MILLIPLRIEMNGSETSIFNFLFDTLMARYPDFSLQSLDHKTLYLVIGFCCRLLDMRRNDISGITGIILTTNRW